MHKERTKHTQNESNRIKSKSALILASLSRALVRSRSQKEISMLKDILYIHLACECAFLNCSNTFKLGGNGFPFSQAFSHLIYSLLSLYC